MPAPGADTTNNKPSRYLPQVALTTLAVVVLPLVIVTGIQMDGGLRSPIAAMAVAVALSVAAATVGSAYWMRRPGSRDLVFGDLMLWGFIRRLRAEQRLARLEESPRRSEQRSSGPRGARFLCSLALAAE